MADAPKSRFVYVTYIRTTPEKLWEALTSADAALKYWRGVRPEADWKKGGAWKLIFPDGRTADSGEIEEYDPSRRLVIRWRNEWKPEFKAEGWSLCVFEIESSDGGVKLTVDHSIDVANSGFIATVSGGWPQILSNLKSLLETGEVVLPPMRF
ncbi:MAG TPA: SRPBCC family protein [Rhodoblastus sp.]|nr:SRPBCC family protein [Rhodoblastus sp.]